MDWRKNIYAENKAVGVIMSSVVGDESEVDKLFASRANEILSNAVELIRLLIPSHQSAIAIVVEKDWTTIRKYFSLSEKYSKWKDYAVPARGEGIHGYMLGFNKPIRLTQEQLAGHPDWKNFSGQAQYHPPMRGWLAAPIIDTKGKNWGLVQLSDKLNDEDYLKEDEELLSNFMKLLSNALEFAWELRINGMALKSRQ